MTIISINTRAAIGAQYIDRLFRRFQKLESAYGGMVATYQDYDDCKQEIARLILDTVEHGNLFQFKQAAYFGILTLGRYIDIRNGYRRYVRRLYGKSNSQQVISLNDTQELIPISADCYEISDIDTRETLKQLLPYPYYEIYVSTYQNNNSVKDTSTILNIPIRTVERRLKELRAKIKKEWSRG